MRVPARRAEGGRHLPFVFAAEFSRQYPHQRPERAIGESHGYAFRSRVRACLAVVSIRSASSSAALRPRAVSR